MSLLETLYADDPEWFKFFTHDEWAVMINADMYFSYVRTFDDLAGVPWRHGGFDLVDSVRSTDESQRSEVDTDQYHISPYETPEHVHIEMVAGYFEFFNGCAKVLIETVTDSYGAAPADLHESTYGLFFTDDTGGKNFVPWAQIESIQVDEDADEEQRTSKV